MTAAASRRRLNEAIMALHRFTRSSKLDALHAEQAGVDLNFAAFRVLALVVEQGPISLGALAEAAHTAPNALSRQVKVLEEGGYIRREPDPSDGRVSVVQATEAGVDACRRLRAANDRLLVRQLRDWTPEELDDLAAKLERLVADLRRPPLPSTASGNGARRPERS